MAKNSNPQLPLHICHVNKLEILINRLYIFLYGAAIFSLIYYRITTLSLIFRTRESPLIPYLLIFLCEIILIFEGVLDKAYRWRPVTRSVYPERLPGEEEFLPVDVFVCTAHPAKEPSLGVMNTVISAMAMDYPPDKINVYLSDDGGSYVTLQAMREARKFSNFWIPFCNKYKVKTRAPVAYFEGSDDHDTGFVKSDEFLAERKKIEEKFDEFKKALEKNSVNAESSVSRDHAPVIEAITNPDDSNKQEVPRLFYVAREKRPSHPHHFKAGALNALIRVSAVISNSPVILISDCDHFCNDPTAARQAMCYYLDPEISPKLAFVQFPQHFHNISKHDIYDGGIGYYARKWFGMDGIVGPSIAGCNLFLKRDALYGLKNIKNDDVSRSKKLFGTSNELIRSIYKNYQPALPKDGKLSGALEKEAQLLASCAYESQSEWGKEVGLIYFSVVEDCITSEILHCQGLVSVWVDPPRPCFLGTCPTNLSDTLVQQARWGLGQMQISLSKYNALWFGLGKMPYLQCMCYAASTMEALYVIPFYGLAIIPQICLLQGIPLYPEISDPFFLVFAFIFLSSHLKHVHEALLYGDTIMTALYELRIWMMKCSSCFVFATLGAFLEKIGLHEANFTLTNKVEDDDSTKRYLEGIYDFQASPLLIGPFCILYILNVAAFIVGAARTVMNNKGSEMLAQLVIPLFGIIVNSHVFEGMVLRTDKARIPRSVTLVSAAIAAAVLFLGSLILIY